MLICELHPVGKDFFLCECNLFYYALENNLNRASTPVDSFATIDRVIFSKVFVCLESKVVRLLVFPAIHIPKACHCADILACGVVLIIMK